MQAFSISGIWEGMYYYPNGDDDPVGFIATISQANETLLGSVSEPDVFGEATTLHASIEGIIDGSQVSFIKAYDPAGTLAHIVNYDGLVNADCTIISGKWNIGEYTGTFEMRREIIEIDLEEEEEVVLVDPGSRLAPG